VILKDKKIGFAITGSFCTLQQIVPQIANLVNLGADILPIISYNIDTTDTRFMIANDLKNIIFEITGKHPIHTIKDAEPIGPKQLLDALIIAPCTGNTLSKLANGITDTPVLMAAKSHLRNNRSVILAVATNDGLGNNAKNIGMLLNLKNIYFVPFGQDDPYTKNNSLLAKMDLIARTVELALESKQIQPVLLGVGEFD